MSSLNDLREAIADALAQEKAYNLPQVCQKLGIPNSDVAANTDFEDAIREAFQSKRSYVKNRLVGQTQAYLIALGSKVLKEYSYPSLEQILQVFSSETPAISTTTRRNILDELFLTPVYIFGALGLIPFLKRVWPLDTMPSWDSRFQSATGDIDQHIVVNSDWDDHYLFEERLSVMKIPDSQFLCFLEELVHPVMRETEEQNMLVQMINRHIVKDGYKLEVQSELSERPVYKAVSISASKINSPVKNLIFAANGPKPELVLQDSVSNDIRIVKNKEYCLVYDRPISDRGLLWIDLVDWWKSQSGETLEQDAKRNLYVRLLVSLQSEPEKKLFDRYFRLFTSEFENKLPALIPQVYLHYDPKTIRQLAGEKRLPRQRMDFLLLFSNYERIVIEVDGKQHYSDNEGKAAPQLYAEMVAEDRRLRLSGYEVYRFGAYELNGNNADTLIENFFRQLFKKYSIAP